MTKELNGPHNEPAFPVPDNEIYLGGLTKMEYFMAHAPAEPWPEFTGVMPEAPKPPRAENDLHWDFDNKEQGIARSWLRDACFEFKDTAKQTEFTAAWQYYWKACADHATQLQLQRRVQWPAYWASQMLSGIVYPKPVEIYNELDAAKLESLVITMISRNPRIFKTLLDV